MVIVVICLIALSALAAADSVPRDSNRGLDNATKQHFLNLFFGKMWGYYIGRIIDPSGPTVLAATTPFKMGPAKRPVCLVGTTNPTHGKSAEEITFTKLVTMILCFGMFGLMVSLPDLKGSCRKETCDSATDIPERCTCNNSNDTHPSALNFQNKQNFAECLTSANEYAIPELDYYMSDFIRYNHRDTNCTMMLQDEPFNLFGTQRHAKRRLLIKRKVVRPNDFQHLGKRHLHSGPNERVFVVQAKIIRLD